MSILFVHERASFTGGVEQNIADTAQALTTRGINCHLAFDPGIPTQSGFLDLFKSTYACSELSRTNTDLPCAQISQIVELTQTETVFLHKVPVVPKWLLSTDVRTVQMVHDHDLCCPRKHKYYAHNSAVCTKPMGMHCYLEGAFLVRDQSLTSGFRYESISEKRTELERRTRLDLSIVASNFMREELLMNGFPPAKVRTVPLAVREAPTVTSAVPSGIPTILYVGQLIRGKGVDLLLRALARLRVPYRALIVGKGNAEKDLRNLSVELGLEYLVEFIGWVRNDELHYYYSAADILAVPSRWPEPFGMVGLEGMRHSKPVVAFNVGGIPDWLSHEETGLLVPPGDVAAFTTALQQLLVDRETAARLGAAGARKIRKDFNFNTYLDRLQEALLPQTTSRDKSKEMDCAK